MRGLRVAGSRSSLTHAHRYVAPRDVAIASDTLTAEQSLPRREQFIQDAGCGLRKTPRLVHWANSAAAFLAAGGYHHLGFNVWRGEGVLPVPEGRVGLRHWTVVPEDPEHVAAVSGRIREAGITTEERGGSLRYSKRG